jgi:hypothetical protein
MTYHLEHAGVKGMRWGVRQKAKTTGKVAKEVVGGIVGREVRSASWAAGIIGTIKTSQMVNHGNVGVTASRGKEVSKLILDATGVKTMSKSSALSTAKKIDSLNVQAAHNTATKSLFKKVFDFDTGWYIDIV